MNEQNQPNPTEVEMQPKKPWLSSHKILGVVFVVAVIAAASSALYYFNVSKSIPATVDLPVHKQASTADWKIYTNDQYGFEFKYPSEIQDVFFNQQGGPSAVKPSWVSVVVNGPDPKKYIFDVEINQVSGFAPLTEDEKIKLANTTAKIVNNIMMKPIPGDGYGFKKDNNFFNIYINNQDATSLKILSTFKFIDKQSIKLADLKIPVINNWQIKSTGRNDFALITETKPYEVSLTGSVSIANQIETNSALKIGNTVDGGLVFIDPCGGPIACYTIHYPNKNFQVIFDIKSTQPAPANLDGIWTPDHKFTDDDLKNMVLRITLAND